jgi:Zn-dependent protease with chaperone function
MVETRHEALATFKIAGRRRSALAMLFATHPPLEVRIERLQSMA